MRARIDLTKRAELFALVVATHPDAKARPEFRQVTKYSRGVGEAIAALAVTSPVLRAADRAHRAAAPPASRVAAAGELAGGCA
jgi:hypothetical protein